MEAAIPCVARVGQHLHLAELHTCIGQQALTLGMNDTFFFALIASAVCAVATIFVCRGPALQAAQTAKKRGEKLEESPPMTMTP
jgi:hypothetical protein